MSRYRRAGSGVSYFFTVVSWQRRPILCDDAVRMHLRRAIELVRRTQPFDIGALVLMPDHLHCIWTLPENDFDFSTRWRRIKRTVSLNVGSSYRQAKSTSNLRHRESLIWQRRFWEHRIRGDIDLARHADYIHFNPVKHGLVESAGEWPYSTFHRYAREGVYDLQWSASDAICKLSFE